MRPSLTLLPMPPFFAKDLLALARTRPFIDTICRAAILPCPSVPIGSGPKPRRAHLAGDHNMRSDTTNQILHESVCCQVGDVMFGCIRRQCVVEDSDDITIGHAYRGQWKAGINKCRKVLNSEGRRAASRRTQHALIPHARTKTRASGHGHVELQVLQECCCSEPLQSRYKRL